MYNQKYHTFNTLYNHKLGFHILGGNVGFETALKLKTKVIKTLELSVEANRQLRLQIPDAFLVGRLFVTPQEFGQSGGGFSAARARQQANLMADKILALEINQSRNFVNGKPIINAWESLNEVLPENATDDFHKMYDEYQVAFLERMRAAGFEAIAMNFGTGNGTGEQWLKLYPGTLTNYKYLGFHEYDWPSLDRLHQQGLREGNGGMWLALRYRRIMGPIRQQYGDQHTVIITECGMTQGVQGGQDIGHLAPDNTVPGSTVITPLSMDSYWQSLLWYNQELMKDNYVMGACLFVTGASGQWGSFEHLGPITDKLSAYQQVVTTPTTGAKMMYGLNTDPMNPSGNPSATQLKDLPVQTVRFTFKDPNGTGTQPSSDKLSFYRQKVSELAQAGIGSLIILTNETLPGHPSSSASDTDWNNYIDRFATRVGQIAQNFANISGIAYQIWNEPDFTQPSSSYDPTLRPAVFGRMMSKCYTTIKANDSKAKVVAAGLASGNPQWLQQVINAIGGNLPADAIAWHPYGQRPEPNWPSASWGFGYVGDLIGAYRQVSSLPQWITEIGVNTGGAVAIAGMNPQRFYVAEASVTNNQLQADYLTKFYAAMTNTFGATVERVYWFCYADGMVPPFGLLDSSGQKKPAYTAYKNLPPLNSPTNPTYAVQYVNHNAGTTMVYGQTSAVSLTIRNLSNWTWPTGGSNPVRVGYKWFTQDGRALPTTLYDDIRTPLTFEVAPSQTVTVNVNVAAPRALGALQLRFDLVHELKTWFSQQGATTLNLPMQISSANTTPAPVKMSITASHNNVTTGTDNINNALDGNPATRWSSNANQTPGMWVQLDLGMVKTVSQVKLDNDGSPNDTPRGYNIRLSVDGTSWTTVDAKPNNTQPVNATFAPTKARYIRIEQTGSSDRWWWSIHEVTVNAQVQPTATASHNNVRSGLDNVGQLFDNDVNTRWSSRAVQTPGMWLELDLNETKQISGLKLDNSRSPNEYPRGYVIRLSQNRQTWTEVANKPTNTAPVDVTFAPQLARYIRIEQTGKSNSAWWSVHEITLKANNLSVSAAASHHTELQGADTILQAFDGRFDTRWSSRAPQRAGMWFEIDLNRTRLVTGLKLDSARSPYNYPRGYMVKASADGQRWEEVGRNLNNDRQLEVNFTPRLARYLRVELTQDAEQWWSIHEVIVKYGGGEMSARASHNNALAGVNNLFYAFDGRADTHWSSIAPQTPGMWFEVNLGEPRDISGLLLDNAMTPDEYPRGYALLLSRDQKEWVEVARQPNNTQRLEADFPRQAAQYLRVVLLTAARQPWSISEVVVKG